MFSAPTLKFVAVTSGLCLFIYSRLVQFLLSFLSGESLVLFFTFSVGLGLAFEYYDLLKNDFEKLWLAFVAIAIAFYYKEAETPPSLTLTGLYRAK
jgi:hypothetical protein